MKCLLRVLTAAMILSLVVLLTWPGQVFSAEFSADLIRSSGGDEIISKVFIKGDLRREEVMEDGELSAVNISRPDKGVSWNIMPDDEMYMEMPLQGMNLGAAENIKDLESAAKMRVLGKETVNGYTCEKRRYDFNDKTQGSVTVWYSRKLDYPVKIHMVASRGESDIVLEYRNIKQGKVPDSMFEIPKGYEKFAIPGMPGKRPGGMPGEMPGGLPKIPGMEE